jgi:hypothetical protein
LRIAVVVALAAVALTPFVWTRTSLAFDARFHRQPKDLPPKLASSLTEQVSDEAGPYLDKEEEKHRNGERYVDLQPKFEYLPNYGPDRSLMVSVKLGGAEYQPAKGETGKGKATGVLKYLVFSYALQSGKWVESAKPRWEKQDLGAAAAKKMTAAAERAEKRKAALAARREALEKAAEKLQKKADQPTDAPPPSGTGLH